MEESIAGLIIEHDRKKLQNLAIEVDKILKEEISKTGLICDLNEARIYNIKTLGVQGDDRSYRHPAEITIKNPKHSDGRLYSEDEFYDFLAGLSTRITNEVRGVNRVLYVTATRDDRTNLFP